MLGASPAAAAWLEVRALAAGGGSLPAHFKIEIDRVAGGGDLRRLLAVGDAQGPNTIELSDGTWRVVGIAAGYWVPEQLVSVEGRSERREVVLKFWPASVLTGRVEPPPVGDPSVHVAFSATPGQRLPTPPPSSIRCPIRQGSWECVLPAGSLDVEIEVPGFAPQTRFGLRLPPGGRVDVGAIRLKRGASVRGFVRTPDGAAVPDGTRIRLLSGLGAPLAATSDWGGSKLEQSTNARGFYQFEGVPPGAHVLEADSPAWARVGTPVLVEGKDSHVKAAHLVLARPSSLELTLRPALGPDGAPWSVELVSVGAGMLAIDEPRAASAAGRFERRGLAAGPYLVHVSTADGNRWLSQEVQLPSPGAVEIDVDVVEIRGAVRLGGRPLPRARLLFGGEFGALRVEARSDEDGLFASPLPRSMDLGAWEVQVVAEDPPVNRMVRHLEPSADGAGHLYVELDVPDARLRGRVVDETGRAQEGIVNVQSVQPLERFAQARTDSNGEFDVVGLSPGKAIVLFRGRSAASAVMRVEIGEDQPTRIEIVARPFLPLRGRIVDGEGRPVAGAWVHAFPEQWTRLWLPPRPATTGEDGRFELGLPFDTLGARVAVRAPGYALASTIVGTQREATIEVTPYGGTLVLDYPRIRAVDFYDAPAAYLVRDRWIELLDNALLQGWSRSGFALGHASAVEARFPARGGVGPVSLVLPQMAAGPYALCLLTAREVLDAEAGRPLPRRNCNEGVLAPWGVLPLSVGDLN
ncbi:MAG: hypothetical protein KJ067_02275 [Vicinamibacteria bacterium]|nr:hypothetical protein [Vicinamibacteria bacterium]